MHRFPATTRNSPAMKVSGAAPNSPVNLTLEEARFLIASGEVIAPTELAMTLAPTIAGVAQVGATLTASGTGTWTGANGQYVYEWQQDNTGSGAWVNIPYGNGAATFVPTVAQLGLKIRVRVRGVNAAGPRWGASVATGVVIAAA